MSLESLTTPFTWSLYSRKLLAKIDHPRCVGMFSKEETEARAMRLAIGFEGDLQEGNAIYLYWLVDPDDGIIVDAKFQAFGQSALIGAAEVACELLIGKNYDQAKRIATDLIDKQVRDKADIPAFPKETYPHLNLVLSAIENAAETCEGLPLPETYVTPVSSMEIGEILEGGYPGWDELPLKKKITIIEDVLDKEIRPYIALDAGGVEVLNLINNREVVISYQGSCTSCIASTGTTLSFIQKVLRAKVHPDISVIPEL